MTPVLLSASWTDLRDRRIPNRLTFCGGVLALVLSVEGLGPEIEIALGCALAVGVPLVALSLTAPDGWGMGDTKLTVVIALLIGPAVGAALFISSLGGLLFIICRRKSRRLSIPFAPFLSAGALAAVVIS